MAVKMKATGCSETLKEVGELVYTWTRVNHGCQDGNNSTSSFFRRPLGRWGEPLLMVMFLLLLLVVLGYTLQEKQGEPC